MGQLAEEFSTLLLSRSQAEERKEKGNNLSPAKAVIFLSRKSGAGFLCFVAVCQVYFIYRGILCYLLLCCLSEAVSLEVRTHFVQSDLHSRRCLSVLALCVGVFFFWSVGKNILNFFFWGGEKILSCKFWFLRSFVRLARVYFLCVSFCF